MTEAPLLNNEAARSATGEILDQSTTQAMEARQAELAAQRLADPKTGDQASSESKPKSSPTATLDPTDTSTTTDDGKTLLTKSDTPTDGPKPTAPDKYEPFKLPAGYSLNESVIESVTPVLKELNLDQTQAQKLVDFHVAQMVEAAKAPQATYEATRSEWQSKVLADPEIKAYSRDGKSGIEAVKIDLGRAMSVMGPELSTEFRAAMDLTGAGDNPAFVKGFWKLAQSVIEGKPVAGRNPSPLGQVDPTKPAKPSAAQSMYPGLPSAAG